MALESEQANDGFLRFRDRKYQRPGQAYLEPFERGNVSRVMLAQEEQLSADLIVIGKHGRSMVEEWLLGGVTRHVLAGSKCDVLVVHERTKVE